MVVVVTWNYVFVKLTEIYTKYVNYMCVCKVFIIKKRTGYLSTC